jgi:hypothetical protein
MRGCERDSQTPGTSGTFGSYLIVKVFASRDYRAFSGCGCDASSAL